MGEYALAFFIFAVPAAYILHKYNLHRAKVLHNRADKLAKKNKAILARRKMLYKELEKEIFLDRKKDIEKELEELNEAYNKNFEEFEKYSSTANLLDYFNTRASTHLF